MLKILFVDHAMHRGTESSAFFVALLETRFAVSRLDIAPNEPPVIDWRFVAGFDAVSYTHLLGRTGPLRRRPDRGDLPGQSLSLIHI